MMTFVLLEDLPTDPTGELHSLRTFIQQNMDVCKWIGIVVVVIQAFSLFLAVVLRTLVSSPKLNYDMEGDYDVVGRTREPLLDPRLSQTSGLAKGDARGGHSDIWSSRMREKAVYICLQKDIAKPGCREIHNSLRDDCNGAVVRKEKLAECLGSAKP
ncbi:hypothetical protein KY289_036610 [Solanum tuberosum]|nr:hypothetical protein KY289_036610 [Solanum tuberosum]